MARNPDEIEGIGDLPEDVADELRMIIRKVVDNHIDDIVVRVYKDQQRSLRSSAFTAQLEEIPREDLEAINAEGLREFLRGREIGEVDQDEALEYVGKYAFVVFSLRYPWLIHGPGGATTGG